MPLDPLSLVYSLKTAVLQLKRLTFSPRYEQCTCQARKTKHGMLKTVWRQNSKHRCTTVAQTWNENFTEPYCIILAIRERIHVHVHVHVCFIPDGDARFLSWFKQDTISHSYIIFDASWVNQCTHTLQYFQYMYTHTCTCTRTHGAFVVLWTGCA